jgi:hypothetical protein
MVILIVLALAGQEAPPWGTTPGTPRSQQPNVEGVMLGEDDGFQIASCQGNIEVIEGEAKQLERYTRRSATYKFNPSKGIVLLRGKLSWEYAEDRGWRCKVDAMGFECSRAANMGGLPTTRTESITVLTQTGDWNLVRYAGAWSAEREDGMVLPKVNLLGTEIRGFCEVH